MIILFNSIHFENNKNGLTRPGAIAKYSISVVSGNHGGQKKISYSKQEYYIIPLKITQQIFKKHSGSTTQLHRD